MQEKRIDEHGLAGLEAQLAALVPRDQIDRDLLMFEAGGRAARRKLRVVNRLLAAACVLLAVTTVAPLVRQDRTGGMAREERRPVEESMARGANELRDEEFSPARKLPDQLVVADSRELAAALAEGRSDLRPMRLRALQDEPGESPLKYGAESQPKSSRELLREYLEVDGTRL